MRSIFAKIVAWSFGTLVLSVIAFFMVTAWIVVQSDRGLAKMPNLQVFILGEARGAYESGGTAAAVAMLGRLDATLGSLHVLLDASGRDVVTGRDWSNTVDLSAKRQGGPIRTVNGVVFVTPAADRKFFLLDQPPGILEPWRYLPYFGLILFAVALLGWPLALHIGTPLRHLAGVVERFGRGDLSARLQSRRTDEIGELARCFDQMADRIETLLVAERRLLQDVSHELRSPLARLSFAAELAATAPDRDAAVGKVKREISRLNHLVGALIEVTREEGDPSARQYQSFGLPELLREVIEDCEVEASGRGIALLPCAPCTVVGDRELIRRAVENVVRNAVYYSGTDTGVEISLAASAGAALIQVRDHGRGVPEELLPRIFQPFFRVDESRTGSTGGLGLGLSIAHRALQLHSGRITARNADPGLLVEIELPLGQLHFKG